MDDLSAAMASPGDRIMLGGGNPAAIPELQAVWRREWKRLLDEEPGRLDASLGIYDPAAGAPAFRSAIARQLNEYFGWSITERNVAITSGGQHAFFLLFNLLAGPDGNGSSRRILLPASPDYIGYSELGLQPGQLVSIPSRIDKEGHRRFRYRIDTARMDASGDIAAACVSRPCNPTANVMSLDELRLLHSWCRKRHAWLIVDNAYGAPFPGMVFDDATPFWDEGVILTYSLSKLGLPGTRTGIVIAPESVVEALGAAIAVTGLSNNGLGQALTLRLVQSGELARLSNEVIKPFYRSRRDAAIAALEAAFAGLPLRIHHSGGALFLWLWFEGVRADSQTLYDAFRDAGVLVVPGHYFFHNLADGPIDSEWDAHRQRCVRINYATDFERFPEAARRMAEVVRMHLA